MNKVNKADENKLKLLDRIISQASGVGVLVDQLFKPFPESYHVDTLKKIKQESAKLINYINEFLIYETSHS